MDRGVNWRDIRGTAFESFMIGYQQLLAGDISTQGFIDGTWQLLTVTIDEAYERGLKEGSYGSPLEIDNTEQF